MEAVPMGKGKEKGRRIPKHVLKLPDLEQSKSALLNSLTTQSSQRTYDHAIRELIEWYCSELFSGVNRVDERLGNLLLAEKVVASPSENTC
jgi:hypothetical protein